MTLETGVFTKQPMHWEPSHNQFRGILGVVVSSSVSPKSFPLASKPYHGTQTSLAVKNTGNRKEDKNINSLHFATNS